VDENDWSGFGGLRPIEVRGFAFAGTKRSPKMSSPAPSRELGAPESYVDWDELSSLDQIAKIYQVGANTVVLDTNDSREIRITAWFDGRSGQFVADFERRCTATSRGQQVRVWAQTSAYPRCVSEDLADCLEAAILAVDRLHVY
jgi:hypothetical protein